MEERAFLALLRDGRDERCHFCFTPLDTNPITFRFEKDTTLGRLNSSSTGKRNEEDDVEHFCSEACLHSAKENYNDVLSSRLRSWPALFSTCQVSGRVYPLMVSRLFAGMLLNLVKTGRLVDQTSELAWNTDNNREESVGDYGLVKELILTERGQADLFNLQFFLAKVSMLNMNAVSVMLPGRLGQLERVGTALFLQSSFFNHSCEPNLDVNCSSGTENERAVKLTAIANQDIARGSQLFISYVDADMEPYNDGDNRRAFLRAAYGFECRCPRCVREKP